METKNKLQKKIKIPMCTLHAFDSCVNCHFAKPIDTIIILMRCL